MSTHPSAPLPLGAEGVIEAASWENEGGSLPSTPRTDDERLDWATFLARFYPGARRHDYESLAAYVEYRKGLAAPYDSVSERRAPDRKAA